MLIDVHTHFMCPEHWGDEFEANWAPVYGYSWPDLAPEGYDTAMAEAGVDTAIVFGLTAHKAGVFTPDEVIVDFCRATTTPTVGFTAADASAPDGVERLERSHELGLRGVKLYPVLSGYGDGVTPQIERFVAKADELGMVILWHMGASPSPSARLRDSQPLFVDDIASRFPDLKQVMAHMGHPWQRDAIAVTRKNRNVYMDVSAQWSRTMEGYLALVHAQEWGVVDRILFGSDYPLWTPQQAIDALWALTEIGTGGLPRVEPETIETILGADALVALGLEGATLG